jgi:hypothetical protein
MATLVHALRKARQALRPADDVRRRRHRQRDDRRGARTSAPTRSAGWPSCAATSARGRAFDIVFISVDPKRDTPQVVRDYVGLFGTPIIGLTGSESRWRRWRKSHAIYQKRRSRMRRRPAAIRSTMAAAVLLFGRDGKFVATIAQEEGDAPALDKLRRIRPSFPR